MIPRMVRSTSPGARAERAEVRARRVDHMVVVMLALLVGWLLAGPHERAEQAWLVTAMVLGAITLFAMVTTSRIERRVVTFALLVLVTWMLIASVSAFRSEASTAELVLAAELLAVGILGPVLVVRGMLQHGQLSLRTLSNAIALYLLIGLATAMLLVGVAALSGEPQLQGMVTIGSQTTELRDAVYWSYVTLSTTGYGDIVPATGSARVLALAASLVGQIYLVVAVAGIVSLLAGRVPRR